MGMTLAEKVWADHLVRKGSDGAPDLLYIDLMLMHEVTSPQAFEGLRLAGRTPRHLDQLIATEDHNTPTVDIDKPNPDETSATQLTTLEKNCREFGVRLHPLGDADQGIVHAFAPMLGLTQPGMTIVCGDSHTSTHGAFGALAFGIGTSEVGGQGYVLEYRGRAIEQLSMDARMTICNMSIEAGARAGMIAPDETTFAYLKGRPHAPKGEMWDQAVEYWKTLRTDDDAVFDAEVTLRAEDLEPFVTWGTNPGQGVAISGVVPAPDDFADATERSAAERALDYMGLEPGTPIRDIPVDTVFIGSCTNGRIEDLRIAAEIMKGHKKADSIHRVLVVPASSRIRLQAEREGLDRIFKDFGAEWRNAGCSMCLGMNPDKLVAHERSISTSNRNFEGRQGKGSRTHLASPAVAAATAIRGTISTPADL